MRRQDPRAHSPHGFRRAVLSRAIRGLVPALLPVFFAGAAAAPPHVVLDGSFNNGGVTPIQPVAGKYTVPASAGKQVGPNLFQSLSLLNPSVGETVSFTGPASGPAVHFVVTRVTGGASNIDGTLQCTIPDANFYLVNPAGVVFGADAKLDIQGSFAVTTANSVKLSDGGKLSATVDPSASVLTSAPPAAFGFLGAASPAAVTVNGASLAAPAGQSLLAVAGPVQQTGGSMTAPGGRIGLVSVASAGEVSFDPATLAPASAANPTLGLITLASGATVTAAGPTGGSVAVQCDSLSASGGAHFSASASGAGKGGAVNLNVANAAVFSGTDSNGGPSGIFARASGGSTGNGGSVNLAAGSLQVTGGAQISASTFGAGNAGAVNVSVPGAVTLDGSGTSLPTQINATSSSTGNGSGGTVSLTAGSLQVLGGAALTVSTTSPGNAGSANVNVSGQTVFSGSTAAGLSGVFARADAGSTGNAGTINLNSGSLQILGGAVISSSSYGRGAGGNVNVGVTGQAILDGADAQGNTSGVFSRADAGSIGNAGMVSFDAGSLQITGGAVISSSTFGAGNGGNVSVNVSGAAVLSRGDAQGGMSGVFARADAGSSGNAGSVTFKSASLQVLGGAAIASDTFGPGAGGNTNVAVTGSALLGGDDAGNGSGVFARAEAGSTGNAGTVSFTSGSLQATGGATVSSSTFGTGNGGDVSVSVTGPAVLSGADSAGAVSGAFARAGSGSTGQAGSVDFKAAHLQVLDGAAIASDTFGPGAGGSTNVTISGPAIVSGVNGANTSGVFSRAVSGSSGNAGEVDFSAASLQVLGGGVISSSSSGRGAAGTVAVTVLGKTVVSGISPDGPSGVYSRASFNSTGDAGPILFRSGNLDLVDGGVISSSTFGAGNGGDVKVYVPGRVTMAGRFLNSQGVFTESGVFASSDPGARGSAGEVLLTAGQVRVEGGALIRSATVDSQPAGGINIEARTVLVTGPFSLIDSRSSSSGAAGPLTIDARTRFVLSRGALQVDAANAQGNNLIIKSPDVICFGGALQADSGGNLNGGNVRIESSDQALLLGTRVSATGPNNGGDIIVDPFLATLDRANLTAEGGQRGGNITIRPTVLLRDGTITNVTGRALANGKTFVTPPNIALAGRLTVLSGALASRGAQLQSQCVQKLGDAEVSSFIVIGNGGLAPEPGGWTPDPSDASPDWSMTLRPAQDHR